MKCRYFFSVFLVLAFCPGLALAQSGFFGGRTIIPFNGSIDFNQSRAQVRLGQINGERSLALDGAMVGRGMYHFRMDVTHAPLPYVDVAAIIEGDARIRDDDLQTSKFTGELKSSNLLLNHMPFRDASLKFVFRDRKLVIESLWAGGVSGAGEFQLSGKHQMDLNVDVASASIEEVLSLVREIRGSQAGIIPDISGAMKGSLNISGVWPRPYIRGRLSAYKGAVQAFNYDMIGLDFEGQYPLLNIKEALVTQADGLAFRLGGMLDLSDLAGLTAQVGRFKKAPVTTSNDNRREWVFQRSSSTDEARTELKYQYLKNDRGDAEAVLGIQKSIGF